MNAEFPTTKELIESIRASAAGVMDDDRIEKIVRSILDAGPTDSYTTIDNVTYSIALDSGNIDLTMGVPDPYDVTFQGSGSNTQDIPASHGSGPLGTPDTGNLFVIGTSEFFFVNKLKYGENVRLGVIFLDSHSNFLGSFVNTTVDYDPIPGTEGTGSWGTSA